MVLVQPNCMGTVFIGGPMLLFARVITKLNFIFFELSKWLIVAIATLMLYEVLSRYILAAPTSWAPEMATLLFGPFFLLGGPYLLHTGGHVSVDLLSSRAQGPVEKFLKAVGLLLAASFGSILIWFAFPLAMDSFGYRETSYTSWNPQIWPAKMALPFAMMMLILQALAELLVLLSNQEASE